MPGQRPLGPRPPHTLFFVAHFLLSICLFFFVFLSSFVRFFFLALPSSRAATLISLLINLARFFTACRRNTEDRRPKNEERRTKLAAHFPFNAVKHKLFEKLKTANSKGLLFKIAHESHISFLISSIRRRLNAFSISVNILIACD